jgi:ERCC4-type nuclease
MGVLVIDTREQKCEHIDHYMEQRGIKTVRSKLYCGDYTRIDNQTVCIDRKQDLQELAGNLCQQHTRFRAEMVRAQDVGIKLIFLIEHSVNINSLDDVRNWVNPRLKTSPKAITGARMAAIMETMAQKYGVEFMFCAKKDTGRIICEILGEPIIE